MCVAYDRKRDITFAAVHDSYWSHPSDVDDMSKHLREEFVRVHKSNCLEVLEVELHRRYARTVLCFNKLFRKIRKVLCVCFLSAHHVSGE